MTYINSSDANILIPTESTKSIESIKTETKAVLANEPMLGFIEHPHRQFPFGVPTDVDFALLWAYVKSSPEMWSLLDALVNDILSDGWILEGEKKDKEIVEDFLRETQAKQVFKSFMFDVLVTGNGYLYKNKLNEKQINTAITNMTKKMNVRQEIKSELTEYFVEEVKADEDIFSTKKINYVASTTMRGVFNEFGDIKKWLQVVPTRPTPAVYTPEEIIHYRLNNLDGRFYGWTPTVAAVPLIDIITNIRDYARYFFERGGDPPRIYTAKDITFGSNEHKALEKAIQGYSQLTNKYKSLILTGDIDVKPVTEFNKDMEFKQLAIYLTQVMIMMWGVPPSRLPNLVIPGGTATQDVSTTEGYYKKIKHMQDLFEDLLNTYLFKEFGVKLILKKNYLQDEVREVQIDVMKAQYIESVFNMGLITSAYAWAYLKIPEETQTGIQLRGEGFEKKQEEIEKKEKVQLSNQQLMQNSDKQKDSMIKQSANIEKKAMEAQGKTPKEIDDILRNKYFSLKL